MSVEVVLGDRFESRWTGSREDVAQSCRVVRGNGEIIERQEFETLSSGLSNRELHPAHLLGHLAVSIGIGIDDSGNAVEAVLRQPLQMLAQSPRFAEQKAPSMGLADMHRNWDRFRYQEK